jgi:uncharacterized RDD family membrane protein YckC
VSDRRLAGGRPSDPAAGSAVADSEDGYPGEGLGLPESGQNSVAGIGRRLLALVIDWAICSVISLAAFRTQLWALPIFAIEDFLLTAMIGMTVGKRLLGMRVARIGGGPIGFLPALIRTLLLLLVVPPLVIDRDLRGLHEKASGTVTIRT